MGFIRDIKSNTMRTEAQAAWNEGSPVFTPILNMPSNRAGGAAMSGRIVDWEQMLAAVLDVGWRLHTWAVASDSKGHIQAQPLFVRP